MQIDNRLLDDLARVAASAAGVVSGVKDEVEARIRQRLEDVLGGLDLVTRDEFEAVREMAAAARAGNEALEKRIAALEETLAAAKPKGGKAKSKSKSSG
jgi:BMFP domain-containing protein YqiC